MRVWIALCLLGLSACSTAEPAVWVTPPEAALVVRPLPKFEGKTYRDVVAYALALRAHAKAQRADKAALRAWTNSLQGKGASEGKE